MLRGPMVIPQQASETIAALDCAVGLADTLLGLDQAIGQALMIPFAMIMGHELLDGTMQTGFTEEDHPLQALGFDGSDKSLGQSVQVRALGRQLDGFHVCPFEHLGEDFSEERIPIVNQVFLVAKEPRERIGQVASHLLHPMAVRIGRDAGDLDLTS